MSRIILIVAIVLCISLLLLICILTNKRETFIMGSERVLLVPNERVKHHSQNFIHALEYYYRSIDKVLDGGKNKYIIGVLGQKHHYIKQFLTKLQASMPELDIDESLLISENSLFQEEVVPDEYRYHDIHIENSQLLDTNSDLVQNMQSHGIDTKEMKLEVLHWMTPQTARSIRIALCGPDEFRDRPRVGIINRKNNRRLLNINSIKFEISALGLAVEEVLFESEDLDAQINFNNSHDIIVAPHGANLSSTPFIPDYGLVIEICNPEWVPYNYFPGLSISSGKSHYLICHSHPAVEEKPDHKTQLKLDIDADPGQITRCIEEFMIHRDRMYQEQNPDGTVLKLL